MTRAPIVSEEAATDLKALFSRMSVEEFRELLDNIIIDNGCKTIEVKKSVSVDADGKPSFSYSMVLRP